MLSILEAPMTHVQLVMTFVFGGATLAGVVCLVMWLKKK